MPGFAEVIPDSKLFASLIALLRSGQLCLLQKDEGGLEFGIPLPLTGHFLYQNQNLSF